MLLTELHLLLGPFVIRVHLSVLHKTSNRRPCADMAIEDDKDYYIRLLTSQQGMGGYYL